jgi:hypothetical protein
MMERIFNDENEPFWRSAKRMELDVIAPPLFRPFIQEQLERTGRTIDPAVLDRLLDVTGGHPYATQELCYFLWEATPEGSQVDAERYEVATTELLRSEHAHFGLIWEKAAKAQRLVLQALAREPGRPLSSDYRRRYKLPAASSVQRALEALVKDELASRDGKGEYRIAEPFLAEWIRRNDVEDARSR